MNLNGISLIGKYNTGEIESYKVEEENQVYVNGTLYKPFYMDEDGRRKDSPSVLVYKGGEIKGISLQETIIVNTNKGEFKAEKIIFYESGKIKKIFPLDGKITGYWSEEDEYKLADYYSFKFDFAEFFAKVISISFYESGEIKSITFWEGEKVNIKYKKTSIKVRIGISIYEDGNIKSIEPALPVIINTKIGKIKCFDKNAIGITGDKNSLEFYEDGNIKALVTSEDEITIYKDDKLIARYAPEEKYIFGLNGEKDLITVKIEFENNNVIFNGKDIYEINKYTYKIKRFSNSLLLDGDLLK